MRPLLALLLLTACGGPDDVGRTTGGPLRDEGRSPGSAGSEDADEAPPRPPRPGGRPYAATPLSPFAEAMTDLALAAVRGDALPTPPVPTQVDPTPSVTWHPEAERPEGDVEVLGFAFEVELVFKHGEPRPDAEGPDRWGSVHAIIGVTRHGLRLVELRPRPIRASDPRRTPPTGMEGLAEVATQLIGALRRGDVRAWELGEADRALLANDAVWQQVREDRPRSVHLHELAEVLADLPDEPLTYRLGDLAVLVATPDERLLSLTLELQPDGQSFALRTEPLVRVGQVWPPVAPVTSSTGP